MPGDDRSIGAISRPAAKTAVVAALVVAISTMVSATPPADEYLNPDLRRRVEELKARSGEPSGNPEVLRERLETLWQWAGAFALQGGVLPPDLPMDLGIAYRAVRGLKEEIPERLASQLIGPEGVTMENVSLFISRRAEELRLKEEEPGAIGTLALSDSGPFEAGGLVRLEQTYAVGSRPLRPGSGILVAASRGSSLQVDAPGAVGYTVVRCSKAGVTLRREASWGEWGSMIIAPVAAYRVVGGTLEKGDTITVSYGDPARGSPGLRVPTVSVDEIFLPVYVDFEGDGNMMAPAWPSFSVHGRSRAKFVSAVAPSIVEPGERFILAIRSEDRYKNPIHGRAPRYEVRLDGKVVATPEPGEGGMTILPDLEIPEPGVYRFEVRPRDGSLSGRSNPVLVREDPSHRILWGDTHGHTNFAEGMGSPDGYFRFGRDVARLDFLTLSEHDIWTDAREWQVMQAKSEEYLDPGRFTTILGYEYTAFYWSGGHRNVYFRTTEGRERVSHQRVLDLDELYAGLRQVHRPEDVLIIPHAHMPGDWRQSDGEMERLVELSSGHGTWEWFGNRFLRNGFEVGFIGSSDNHAGQPGYAVGSNRQLGGLAAVLAPQNDRQTIFDALRDRLCYATTGERIVVEATLNGGRMGQRVPASQRREIEGRVHGTQPIDRVDVVKNGEVVYTKRYLETGIEPHSWVQVVFESSSELFGAYRGPSRRQRDWKGHIEVRGATLLSLKLPWYFDPETDHIERSAENLERVDLAFNTRGRGKGILLELRGADAATEVGVHLDAVESDRRQILPREAERLPERDLLFRLGDLSTGPAVEELPVGENVDRVEAQLVSGDGSLDQEFVWRDMEGGRPGDYYYVRVRQIDGSMAWTSPFWVGERKGQVGR